MLYFAKVGDVEMEFVDVEMLMDFFEVCGWKGVSISCYKGFGEMNFIELWEMMMNFDSRVLR